MDDGHSFEAPDLYKRIAAGDEAAFRSLVEQYTPRLQAMAARITGSVAVADDLVQDTFLKIWVTRDQLTEVTHPGAWVKKICFFLAVNYVRRQQIREKVMDTIGYEKETTITGVPVAEMIEFHQLLGFVNNAVQQLPEKQQQIYRLSREQGWSMAEIAIHMGLAVSTVKNLQVMALKNIRASLQKAGYPLLLVLLMDILL
ncbi:RNA polymerase sigma factor [Chitinophaga arvensicola]|uniref:RNA polymerase sigma-70 factor, ECF subfamily n=1 Tax=Chitinophaga arvensicola TaxID=29529 RepID=A0A1I0R9Y1_9BACT|nr:sigma-70 family RNA polymerase sigma factor [Chitinophaga arvensicola]SEW37601.1 RNA polymerase sigma-70 factor, ECF subfamily [Chitinophaga arvensicola]